MPTTDKGYTTKALIQAFLGGITIADDLSPYILATQAYIDGYTSRSFKADSTASARYFNGDGSQELTIDDCVEITKVEVGVNAYGDSFSEIPKTGANRYYTLPNNNTAWGVPIRKIFSRANYFIMGIQNQKITAKWGWATTPPEDLQMSATIIASGMYNANRQLGDASVKSESIGSYSVSYDNINGSEEWASLKSAINILNSYKKAIL
jgi:hypothetical protein